MLPATGGDGPLAFTCYEVINRVSASIHAAHTPNVNAVVQCLSGTNTTLSVQLCDYAHKCVQPGLDYCKRQLDTNLKVPLTAFKSCQLFMPHKAHEMQLTATSLDAFPESIPFITSKDLKNLKVELPAYLACAAGTSAKFSPLEWWKNNSSNLPQ